MLRRTELLAPEAEAKAKPEREAAVVLRQPEVEGTFIPKVERRKAERRGMDALRDEALRNLITRVEDRNFRGLRNGVRWTRGIHPSRIILLVVALMAGGLAAYLASRQEDEPTPQPASEVVREARMQILVAKEAIGVGQKLLPTAIGWEDWPEGAVRADYITMAGGPEAMTAMAGSVARSEILPGEPIRQEKLAPAGEGYLSALLDTGSRGVSVAISAESASGGFIVPNDHVDVVLTRPSNGGQVSDTILRNVRVLAINARLGVTRTTDDAANPDTPDSEVFSDRAIATLELDPTQAEVIINATTIGQLTLVLRPTADAADTDAADQHATNQAIRISSPFWQNTSGSAQGD